MKTCWTLAGHSWTFVSVGHEMDTSWTSDAGHLQARTKATAGGNQTSEQEFVSSGKWRWLEQLLLLLVVVKVDTKNTNYTLNNLGTLKCSELTLASTTADGGGHQLYSEKIQPCSSLECSQVLWSALNLPRLILIPSTPRALLTALNVWSAVKSEWLAIGVGNVLQWKVHSRHWHPALFLVKIHSAENLFFKIESDENLLVKMQIQLSYTFKEKVFFSARLTLPKIFHLSVKLPSV